MMTFNGYIRVALPTIWVVILTAGAVDLQAEVFTIPESKLLDSEFEITRWGGTVVRSDAPGSAVQFAYSGLSDSGTGLKDDYPVDTVYEQILPSHGNGDFTNFAGYLLDVENLDEEAIWFSLFINTGFTGPSGIPPDDWRNDTFWQCPWMEVPPGARRLIRLDFDNAIPWNISDNPSPHTQGTDGLAMAINDFDRSEVSAIGFEIRGPGNPQAAVLITPCTQAELIITASPSAVNTVTPSVGVHKYDYGATVGLSAVRYVSCPDVFAFSQWQGDVADPNMSVTTVVMDNHKSVTAVFYDDRRCGDECHLLPPGDVNKDCRVDLADLAVLAGHWLLCNTPECD